MLKNPTGVKALAFLLILAGGGLVFGAEQARRNLEASLSQTLQVPVKIRRVSFLPWAGSFTIKELTLAVAGVPLEGQGRLTLTSGSDGLTRAEGWLSLIHPLIEGRVEIAGPARAPVLMGWLENGRLGRRHFVAQLELRPEAGGGVEMPRMQIQGGWEASGQMAFPGRGGGPWNGVLRIAGRESRFTVEMKPAQERRIQALLVVRRDGLPPQEIRVEWEVRGSTVDFEAVLRGAEAVLKGQVSLRPPYPVEVTVDLNDLKLRDLAEAFFPALVRARVGGQVWGRVTLSGPLSELASRGEVAGENGEFNHQRIRGMSLRFRGIGPVLRIEDSYLVRPEGTLIVEGAVDLRRLGQPDFFRAVKTTSTDRHLEVAGWQVSLLRGWQTDSPSPAGLEMRRSASDTGAPVGVNIRVKQDEEFVGVEHHGKF